MLAKGLRSFAQNALRSGVCAIPAAEKALKGTEDAYCITSRAIALADGVGGWSEQGVNPAAYSNELMKNVKKALESLPEDQRLHPRAVLRAADRDSKVTGSATCTIAILDPKEPWLYAGNIGDSGFYLIRKRDGKVDLVNRSEERLHGFNFPCQLGTGGDNPDKAWYAKLAVQDQDIVVMYSDGFSDNVYPDQMLQILSPFLDSSDDLNLDVVAERLVEHAKTQSEDEAFDSPFARAAKRSRLGWNGGKPDDITVIVSKVGLAK